MAQDPKIRAKLDSILRHFNLTHEDLRKKVSHKHVGKFKCEWWRLPAYLDMDPKIKDDIERNRGLTDEPMKRQNFFEQWKHLNGENATYEALVIALLECDCRADAEDVCKLLLVDKAAAGDAIQNVQAGGVMTRSVTGKRRRDATIGNNETDGGGDAVLPKQPKLESEGSKEKVDLSAHQPRMVQDSRRKYNLQIKNRTSTGFWWLHFTFDYEFDISIEVHLTNKSGKWVFKVTKCKYLGITSEENMVSFDMVDDFINTTEPNWLNDNTTSMEKLYHCIETNMIPIITSKIKYTKYKPNFRIFLSHKTTDKPFMRTFENGLQFLGYDKWLDEADMPLGANLQGALKTSIEKSDCLLAWMNADFFKSEFCKAELLYAHEKGKIILPFGVYSDIKQHLTGDLKFVKKLLTFDPRETSFFEILRRIDETLFNFEKLPL